MENAGKANGRLDWALCTILWRICASSAQSCGSGEGGAALGLARSSGDEARLGGRRECKGNDGPHAWGGVELGMAKTELSELRLLENPSKWELPMFIFSPVILLGLAQNRVTMWV